MKNEKMPPPDKQEQYEDALFALLMEDFARQEGQRLEELEQQGLPPLPEGLQQRLETELAAQWRARNKHRHRWRRWASKAAILLLVVTAGFAAMYTNVDAFRDKVRQLVMEYTDVSINFGTDDMAHLGLQGHYAPTWLPEGFEVATIQHAMDDMYVEYKDGGKGYIIFSLYSESGVLGVDSEDADFIVDVDIKGGGGKLISKQGHLEIVWHNGEAGQMYTIFSGDLSEAEIIKMAKSVKFIN